ncbi:hypothetical protein L484_005076 [Morus notabilis]|uniref:Uncharacterized protein n=1 Tax=Morus notabilis TaxID=981085 RepID=W9RVR2_9ROSA|nr:hypothetical protein L484_005076 [Morus notabilis]
MQVSIKASPPLPAIAQQGRAPSVLTRSFLPRSGDQSVSSADEHTILTRSSPTNSSGADVRSPISGEGILNLRSSPPPSQATTLIALTRSLLSFVVKKMRVWSFDIHLCRPPMEIEVKISIITTLSNSIVVGRIEKSNRW